MRGKRLTQLAVDRLKLEPGERVQIADGVIPGLELRASWGGSKVFWLRFRHGGQQYRHRIGTMPLGDARKAARALLAQLDQGINPLVRAESSGTVRNVYLEWLARDQAGNKSVREVRRALEREMLPAWGERPIEAVRKRDVIALVDGIADRGAPVQANRALAYIKRMLAWAAARDLIEASPAAAVEKPGEESSRDRVLTDAELATVWRACAGMGPFGAGVRLLICTAARRSDIFEARWSEVRLDGPEPAIVLPAERVKVAEGRVVGLNRLAVRILEALPLREGYMISLTGGHPLGSIGKAKRKLDASLPGMAPWVLHDIRRSVATGMQRLGVRLEVIEAVLGHVSGSRAGVIRVYQRHRWEAEARAALDAWGKHVEGLIGTT